VSNSVLTSIAAALLPGGTTWRFNTSDDLRVRNGLGNTRRLRSTCYDPINLRKGCIKLAEPWLEICCSSCQIHAEISKISPRSCPIMAAVETRLSLEGKRCASTSGLPDVGFGHTNGRAGSDASQETRGVLPRHQEQGLRKALAPEKARREGICILRTGLR
jgi:hypothetical protein